MQANKQPKRNPIRAIDLFEFSIACVFLVLCKLSVKLIRFETLARLYSLKSTNIDIRLDPTNSNRQQATTRAIKRAARHLPGAYVCLPQALAGKLMLQFKGVASFLVLGVKIDESKAMSAHAWLVSENSIILGGFREDFKSVAVFE